MTSSKRYRVLPYRQGSKGAKALADALGGRVLKLVGSTFVPKNGDVIINWGNTQATSEISHHLANEEGKYLNYPQMIRMASNKLMFFQTMKGSNLEEIIPEFWTSSSDIPDEKFPVVCRTVLAGHSGDGIHIADTRDGLVPAPLYTRYVKKKDEYRIHVGRKDGGTSIISVQRKARRAGFDNPNWKVRNLAGGFVYVRNEVSPPAGVLEAATKALEATGLDFGAVDAIYNEQQGRSYVLEINTAPGLEGQTVEDYKNFFS